MESPARQRNADPGGFSGKSLPGAGCFAAMDMASAPQTVSVAASSCLRASV